MRRTKGADSWWPPWAMVNSASRSSSERRDTRTLTFAHVGKMIPLNHCYRSGHRSNDWLDSAFQVTAVKAHGRRSWVGRAAARRIRAGGPRALGRHAASAFEWASIRTKVLSRAGWRCQACGVRRRLDVHQILKPSQGGSELRSESTGGAWETALSSTSRWSPLLSPGPTAERDRQAVQL